MSQHKATHMTATRLRIILAASLFVILGIISTVFYFGREQLANLATDVSHAHIDADASSQNLNTLRTLKQNLDKNASIATRANQLAANSADYDYQNQIINDLESYSHATGVGITGIDFSAGGTTAAPSGPAISSSGSGGGGSPVSSVASKTTSVVVGIQSPVDYASLLNFVHAIEQNLPKLQIARLSLSRATSSSDKVTISSIAIQMYIK